MYSKIIFDIFTIFMFITFYFYDTFKSRHTAFWRARKEKKKTIFPVIFQAAFKYRCLLSFPAHKAQRLQERLWKLGLHDTVVGWVVFLFRLFSSVLFLFPFIGVICNSITSHHTPLTFIDMRFGSWRVQNIVQKSDVFVVKSFLKHICRKCFILLYVFNY